MVRHSKICITKYLAKIYVDFLDLYIALLLVSLPLSSKANFDLTAPWLSTGANYDDEYERLQLRNESLRDSVVAVRDVWLLAKIDTMAG